LSDNLEKEVAQPDSADEGEFELHSTPDDVPEKVMGIIARQFSARGFSAQYKSAEDSLIEKFNDSHVEKFLDIGHDSDKRAKRYSLAYFLGVVAFLVFLIVFLKQDKTLLNTILQTLLAFACGFGGGYGYRSWKE
jgi:hypothetical protein